MKYNICKNEGDVTSATVFFGADQYIATPDHPRFSDIVARLRDGSGTDDELRALFDVTVPIGNHFKALSERVAVNAGRVFFDGDEVDSALAKTIVAFYSDGHDDFMPLVNFMEKIATNPTDHSRENLFRWLRKHKFGICPDGDFIAYKSVTPKGRLSHSSGRAIVNGEVINGLIPNQTDTIVEMPRSAVQHDPSHGCSTGLHVGNWSFASTFHGGSVVIRVKINPRDVVSVPTESSDRKMRVCRYRVLDVVTAEDKDMLYVDVRERLAVSKAVERKVVKPKVVKPAAGKTANPQDKRLTKPLEFPEYYEQFTEKHFEACPRKELNTVARIFEMKGYSKLPAAELIPLLLKTGRARKKTWPADER